MATTTTLGSHVTAPVNFVLMRGLLSAARRTFPYFNGTMPGTLEENGGSMSVKWRRIENLAPSITALGEVTSSSFGMGRDAAVPTVTDLTVAIAKYGNFMHVAEEVDLFNVNSRSAQLMDTLGENAGHSLNILQRNVLDAQATGRFADGVSLTSSMVDSLDTNDIKYAVNQLNREAAMKFFPMGTGSTNVTTSTIRSSYFGICHSDVEEDIRAETTFLGVEQYAGYTETFMEEFGALGGVRWASTQIAPVNTSGGVTTATGMRGATDILNDAYTTFIYGREAIGTVGLGDQHAQRIYKGYDEVPAVVPIFKPVGSSGAADPFNEVGSIAWKAWYAGRILNDNWLVVVESLATDLA